MPRLQLVRAADVRFHEHPERQRTDRLVARLRRDGVLRNPPIVAALDERSYVLLDGANRLSAFRELGHGVVPVQIVDYASPAIQLKSWHHLLLEGAALGLRATFGRIPGVRLEAVSPDDAADVVRGRRAFAVLVDETQACWALRPAAGDVQLDAWLEALDGVVSAYEGRTRLERIKWADDSDLPPSLDELEHQLLLFPTLEKQELLDIVRSHRLIPTGITRHIVNGRALALDLDLDFLSELQDDTARIAHFDAYVQHLMVEGRVRYYEESVFILDE
jgi:hypothetical protein